MHDTIQQWWIDTYNDNVIHALQQKDSKLSPLVSPGTMTGQKQRFNYIGQAAMREVTGKNQDTIYSDIDFWNRWVSRRVFTYDGLIDKYADIKNSFTDPSSDIVKAAVMAAKRQKDDIIIGAMFGTAWTGENAETAVVFPDARKIDVQLGSPSGAPANTGLTLAKILRAKYLLDVSDIDEDEPRFFGVTAWQLQELLNTTEIKNADYNNVKALAEGKVDTFAGFKFVRTEKFTRTGGIRYLPAWTKESVKFSLCTDIQTRANEESTKNYNIHVHVEMAAGATRLFDEGVVMVPCDETV